MSATRDPRLTRWRLVLGDETEEAFSATGGLSAADLARDRALSWLYDAEEADDEGGEGEGRDLSREGGRGRSTLTVPQWINDVHELFPRATVERLEREAVEEHGIHEVVTSPEVLARVQPSETLLRAVLLTKHLMSPDVRQLARALVAKVVADLVRTLSTEVRRSLTGARSRRSSLRAAGANLDARRTIQKNLAHYDRDEKRLYLRKPYFFSRTRRSGARWQVILLVDQSGSMLSSVIHSAVTASCLWGVPSVKAHLIAFDTEVVDLTSEASDPVELLMRVQLGGGTDIAKAVRYGESLIENPRRTLFAIVSDFYEGGDREALVRAVERMCAQGVRVLGLAALDQDAVPAYDADLARRLASKGAHVGAMTPAELVGLIADAVR